MTLQALRARSRVERFAEPLDRARRKIRIVEDWTQCRLGLREQAELQLRVGERIEAGGVERDVVPSRKRLHPLGDLHRLMGIARVVLEPGEVVEDLDPQRDVLEPVRKLQRGAVALAGGIPGSGADEHLPESEEVVGAHPLRHGIVQQLDCRDRMLPRARDIADEVEEHGEQPVAASHEMTLIAFGGPFVDLPDQLAARCVLALAAEHVGLDQLRSPLCDLVAQRTRALLERHRGRVCGVGIRERQELEEVQLTLEALEAARRTVGERRLRHRPPARRR